VSPFRNTLTTVVPIILRFKLLAVNIEGRSDLLNGSIFNFNAFDVVSLIQEREDSESMSISNKTLQILKLISF